MIYELNEIVRVRTLKEEGRIIGVGHPEGQSPYEIWWYYVKIPSYLLYLPEGELEKVDK